MHEEQKASPQPRWRLFARMQIQGARLCFHRADWWEGSDQGKTHSCLRQPPQQRRSQMWQKYWSPTERLKKRHKYKWANQFLGRGAIVCTSDRAGLCQGSHISPKLTAHRNQNYWWLQVTAHVTKGSTSQFGAHNLVMNFGHKSSFCLLIKHGCLLFLHPSVHVCMHSPISIPSSTHPSICMSIHVFT